MQATLLEAVQGAAQNLGSKLPSPVERTVASISESSEKRLHATESNAAEVSERIAKTRAEQNTMWETVNNIVGLFDVAEDPSRSVAKAVQVANAESAHPAPHHKAPVGLAEMGNAVPEWLKEAELLAHCKLTNPGKE